MGATLIDAAAIATATTLPRAPESPWPVRVALEGVVSDFERYYVAYQARGRGGGGPTYGRPTH